MINPLILRWDRSSLSEEDFFRQLFVFPAGDQREKFIAMVSGIGTFVSGSRYINILRPDDGHYEPYVTDCWTIERENQEVYKPLSKMRVE